MAHQMASSLAFGHRLITVGTHCPTMTDANKLQKSCAKVTLTKRIIWSHLLFLDGLQSDISSTAGLKLLAPTNQGNWEQSVCSRQTCSSKNWHQVMGIKNVTLVWRCMPLLASFGSQRLTTARIRLFIHNNNDELWASNCISQTERVTQRAKRLKSKSI